MATVAEIFETMEYGPAPESDAPAHLVGAHNPRSISSVAPDETGRCSTMDVDGAAG
jgi:hypothetical protein